MLHAMVLECNEHLNYIGTINNGKNRATKVAQNGKPWDKMLLQTSEVGVTVRDMP